VGSNPTVTISGRGVNRGQVLLAQWIAHPPSKREVVGSSPT
jgi:hypothetical protein